MTALANFLTAAVDDTRFRALFGLACVATALVSLGFYADMQNRRPSPILSVEVLPAKAYELPSLRPVIRPAAPVAKPRASRPAANPLQVASR